MVDYPEIFALGDLADIRDTQGKQVPATAQAAYQQAKYVAQNLWAALVGRPLLHFRYLHLGEMLTLGTNAATVSSFGIINLKGYLACVTRRLIYLLLRMPTFHHRLQVGRHWLAGLVFLEWLPGSWYWQRGAANHRQRTNCSVQIWQNQQQNRRNYKAQAKARSAHSTQLRKLETPKLRPTDSRETKSDT